MTAQRYQLAVGIKYRGEEDSAPQVIVKGEADLADRIVSLAARYGVAVVENDGLADAMQAVPLDTEIPEELYRAVAVVFNQIEEHLRSNRASKNLQPGQCRDH